MTWPRPVPLVGDTTTAAQRAADPAGWAFTDAERQALAGVVAARRDVRRFRPDPVPEALLTALLAAGHNAPSVGHSQPWRFVVVTGAGSRDRAAALADRERLRQAALLDAEAARQLLDLQLEGLREAPVGIVVCCDRRTPAAGVLGRATYPDADLWSCAAAIQNIWLTARAHGLGLGWVTLFRPDDLAELVGLPDGVETLGWLCVGWPDERQPSPGLERSGWSRRRPLESVVMHERWTETDAPVSRLRGPDPHAVVAARDDADVRLTPPSSLGVLDRAVDRLLSFGAPGTGTLVLAAADHPVTRHGVSTYDASVTRDVLRAAVAGEALGVVTARACGLAVTVVDAGVDGGPVDGAVDARARHPRGDLATGDALHPDDARDLVEHGRALGLAAEGPVVLGEVGIGNTTVAAALAAALLGLSADEAVGLGAGGDSATLERKRQVVAQALARGGDPLTAVGGAEIAVLVGVTLGAAEAGHLVVLDGLATSVAALVACRREPAVQGHLVAGQRSREQAHALVLTELGLEPLLDLRLRSGEGVGGCLAAQLLLTAARARAGTGQVT